MAGVIDMIPIIAAASIFLLFLFSGCIQPEGPQEISQSVVSEEWVPDGIVGENEYSHTLRLYSAARQGYTGGEMWLSWKIDDEHIYMALNGSSRGWLAIGFEPSEWMKDADIILGFVGTNAKVLDEYSTGNYGPHIDDLMLGGTDDILEYGGKGYEKYTIIEFKRRLDTGDRFDKILQPGKKISIIWAISESKDPSIKHNIAYGEAILTLDQAKSAKGREPENITAQDAYGMLYIWQEEKAARDLYESLYERTNLTIFKDLVRSEQNHMDQVRVLMERYGVEIPVLGRGVFENQTLSQVYRDLLDSSISDEEALKAAVTFEEISIMDLEEMISRTENPEIIAVYEGLLAGSKKHLRSYVGDLKDMGIEAHPTYLSKSEFDEIIRDQQ